MSGNILEMTGIEKSFSQVSVLKGIDFSVKKGEVRALVGANGAGKSTLMKILGGVLLPNKGSIILKGESVSFHSPIDAINNGISIIYQELSLVKTMSVYENVYLNRESQSGGILDKKRMRRDYEKLAGDLKFNIPAHIKVGSLNIANQQLVEIIKAISIDAEIIVMDEPTTSLTDAEKVKLFDTIKSLKQQGKTIIYISHILRELFEVADSITVMRDGEIVGNFPKGDITQMEVAGLVMNQKATDAAEVNKGRRIPPDSPVVLELINITKAGVLKDISFSLRKGEILGLAGLLGAGRTELCRAVFGDLAYDSGEILLNGKACRFRLPKDAIREGIGLIPEDRKNKGLILKHSMLRNSTIVSLKKMSKFGIVSKRHLLDYSNEQVEKLKIKVSDMNNQVATLSGGNQQKVVVSKWFGDDLQVYIFDEPTKGIDVGAKKDIFKLVTALAEGGASVIFVSSDLEEVLMISDRILAMSRGCIVKEFERADFNLQNITAHCMGISEAVSETEGDTYGG